MKQYAEAIKDCDKALALNTDYAEVYSNRGAIKGELKQYAKALKYCDQAIALNPNYVGAYYNRGETIREVKKDITKTQDFQKVLEDLKDKYSLSLKKWRRASFGLGAATFVVLLFKIFLFPQTSSFNLTQLSLTAFMVFITVFAFTQYSKAKNCLAMAKMLEWSIKQNESGANKLDEKELTP